MAKTKPGQAKTAVAQARDSLSEQYALQLFEDTIGRKGRSATIADAESDLTFPKNNVFVDVSGIGLLARRGLNVMNYLAGDAPVEQLDFDCDVDLFKFLINYASRNQKHLKDALREAQKTSIVVERDRPENAPGNPEFVSIPLVGMVGIANGRVFFRFDPTIRKLHKDPRGYTLLSLRMTSNFKSVFAHSLYEKLKSVAYRGSPTEWLTVEAARVWVGAQDSKFMDEFKMFRQRALSVAIEQINELSDLHVEYETRNVPGSKKVSHIRFVFRVQEGEMTQSMRLTEVRKTIYDTLRGEFGVGAIDLQAITMNAEKFTPERIQAAIDFVRHRMTTGRGKKVQFPGRLFMKALQEGWTVPTAEVQDAQPAAARRKPAVATQVASASVVEEPNPLAEALRQEFVRDGEQGFKLYLASDAEKRREQLASFARTAHFRVLCSQLQLDKKSFSEETLHSNERLRHAFGKHVLNARKKAARKGQDTSQVEMVLS
ncbi:replication initiation protein [Azohydromonas aeria]|uniref:replication initiation protein n=1 Tax=Azohydromonas aeria TaxID=2590212 RepID=UPI0012FC0743|nr:replication initiation protein [Azohydromonas aeria]